MYYEPLVGNVLVPNPRKSAGKTAVCVQVSSRFPSSQRRYKYPAGFYVKGDIDRHHFKMVKLIQLKDGSFLFPVPADIRRKLKKQVGDTVYLSIRKDRVYYGMHHDFLMALFQQDALTEPKRFYVFLSDMEKHRYNEWIWLAKDDAARADRVVRVLYGLRHGLKFEEMRKATKDWSIGR